MICPPYNRPRRVFRNREFFEELLPKRVAPVIVKDKVVLVQSLFGMRNLMNLYRITCVSLSRGGGAVAMSEEVLVVTCIPNQGSWFRSWLDHIILSYLSDRGEALSCSLNSRCFAFRRPNVRFRLPSPRDGIRCTSKTGIIERHSFIFYQPYIIF